MQPCIVVDLKILVSVNFEFQRNSKITGLKVSKLIGRVFSSEAIASKLRKKNQ